MLPSILDIVTHFIVLVVSFYIKAQWRRQDLLWLWGKAGNKSWSTQGGLQDRVHHLLSG